MKKLAVIQMGDFWHPWDSIEPALKEIFPENEWILRLTDDPNYIGSLQMGPDLMVNFMDGIQNTSIPTRNWYETNAWESWGDFYMVKELIARAGTGYLAIHCGLANIPETCPVYTDILHGRFITHPPKCPVTVHITAQHPITEGVSDFTIDDEHYQMQGEWDKTNVLAMTESEHGSQVGVFAHELGMGRVCGITPGHTTEVLTNPNMLKLLRNAANWCVRK